MLAGSPPYGGTAAMPAARRGGSDPADVEAIPLFPSRYALAAATWSRGFFVWNSDVAPPSSKSMTRVRPSRSRWRSKPLATSAFRTLRHSHGEADQGYPPGRTKTFSGGSHAENAIS
jgi:hypothetical protein